MRYVLMAAMLCGVLAAFSCDKQQDACDGVNCTLEFRTLVVEIFGVDRQPYVLDEYYLIRKSTGQKLERTTPVTTGTYILLDDSYQDELENKTEDFQLIGIKNGKRVVDEPYTFKADCCHVNYVSGSSGITVAE